MAVPGASRRSIIPSRSRSIPAQAIIAPLSVQSFGGGATRGKPASAQNCVSASRSGYVGRDAASDHHGARGDAKSPAEELQSHADAIFDHIDHRRLKRGAEIGDVARAQRRDGFRRITDRGLEPGQREISVRAVQAKAEAGRIASGSPSLAAASTAGPPGNGSPSSLAVLSNASPIASSMVAPRRS